MGWLQDNVAVLSAVVVPVFLGIIGPLRSREAGGREYRRIRRHAQLRSLLPATSDAAEKMDELLSVEVARMASRYSTRSSRRIDGGNLAAVIVVSLLGGLVSFGLVTWAQASVGFWAWVAWILCVLWTLFVVLLVLVGGLSNLYKSGKGASDG